MAFVSWAAEQSQIENQLSELHQNLNTQAIGSEGRNRTLRNLSELQNHYEWVKLQAQSEAGTRRENMVRLGDVS